MEIEINDIVFIKSLKAEGKVIGRAELNFSKADRNGTIPINKGDLIVVYETSIGGNLTKGWGYFSPDDLELVEGTE